MADRVEWWFGGKPVQQFALVLKTDDGRETYVPFRDGGRPCVLGKFCEGKDDKPWDLSNELFEQDPRRLHPTWTADTLAVMQKGFVAVGMTMDMVKATCGRFLVESGAALSPEGKAWPIYRCNGYEFVIEKGKVTKSDKND